MRRLYVSADGKLGLCEKMGESWIIGDVTDGFDRLSIERLIQTYVQMSSELCTRCWAVRLCSSCFVHARKGNSLNLERKKEHCKARRRNLMEAMINYCKVMERNPRAFDSMQVAVAT
ncbi:MAG: SPASM domain-containing protein [Bacteroidota bacterium]